MKTLSQSILRWFFTLLIVEWLLALYSFYSDHTNFFNLEDLSIFRLIINLGILGITALLVAITLGYWRERPWTQRLTSTITTYLVNEKVYWIIIILSGVGFVLNLYIVLAYQSLVRTGVENLFIAPYLEFIRPFAWITLLAAIQVSVAARLLRFGLDVSVFQPYRQAFRAALASLLILTLLVVLTALTGLGLRTDVVGWGTPGVPILSMQVLLALAVLVAVWGLKDLLLSSLNLITGRNIRGVPDWSADLLICILLWGAAVWLWGAQPLKPTYFSPAPLPPNYEYYPNSDAVHYDLDAIKLLNGIGYDPDAIRPLYVLFLALSHAVSGLDYQSVVVWQIILYAMIPVLIYLLGKSLHHRFSGALAGILMVLREYNAIALAGEINTSHAKLIMADLPITLFVILFTLIIVRWLQDPSSRKLHPVLAGGVLALAILIRLQVAVLLPVTLLIMLAFFWHKSSLWLRNGILLGVSTLIVLSPWILRTWQISGMLGLSEMANPTQANLIAERYSLELQPIKSSSNASETEGKYVSRVTGSAQDFILKHPEIVAEFVINHFMHNQIATLLALPASLELVYDIEGFDKEVLSIASMPGQLWSVCCSEHSYVRALPFWKDWDGTLDRILWIPVMMSAVLLAVGVGIAANKWQLVGLIPLLFLLGYSFSNATIRNSGWRYILPVDWAGILYFAIGVAQLSSWLITYFANKVVPVGGIGLPEEEIFSVPSGRYQLGKAVAILIGFTLIATAMPLVERIIPDRYADANPVTVMSTLESSGVLWKAGISQETIQPIVDRPDNYLTIGLGMYPRFFEANQGDNGTGSPDVIPTSDNRLIFYLANTNRDIIALPMSEPPETFPNSSDVLVLGCQMDRYILAEMVMILGESPTILARTPDSGWRCSTPDDVGP